MKILNFGSCNIDYVYSLDHIVEAGETEATERLDVFPGGKGLNQSIAIARAGAKVYHAGYVGFDGDMLTEVLEQSGVDTSYIKRTSEKNGHAIIQVSRDGENSIFLYPGSNHLITEDYIDSVLKNFERGDYAAARVVMRSGAPFVQLPCSGVVSSFTVSRPELEFWLKGKNPLATYLAENTIEAAEMYASGRPWTRVMWDVTAVAWLLNDDDRFMLSRIVPTPIPTYEGFYALDPNGLPMRYVYHIKRDALMTDLFKKITE